MPRGALICGGWAQAPEWFEIPTGIRHVHLRDPPRDLGCAEASPSIRNTQTVARRLYLAGVSLGAGFVPGEQVAHERNQYRWPLNGGGS
jgi:hypothetical protein